MLRIFTLFAAGLCACGLAASAQDTPPLGDVARQTRVDKQQPQSNSTPALTPNNSSGGTTSQAGATPPTGTPKTSHVITDEDLPSHPWEAAVATHAQTQGNLRSAATEPKRPAAYWKAQAQQLKNSIAQVQRHIDTLTDSLHAVLTNSTDEPVWNLREKERQRQITDLQAQLNDLHRRLEDTQEAARRQGYGSSVYDP